MARTTLRILFAFCPLFLSGQSVFAGLINVNLTNTSATSVVSDGNGALGGGSWNRIDDADAALTNALVTSGNLSTSITLTQSAGASANGFSQANGNAIQSESWGNGTSMTLTISGLIANQPYRVAIYTDRLGNNNSFEFFTVNSVSKSLPNSGATPITLPGVENTDYTIFTVDASTSGVITMNSVVFAGIQIEGVLPGEPGPQADCLITKSKSSSGGKGNGIYSTRVNRSQSLALKAKGKKPRSCYANVQNDGEEMDRFYLMGFWDRKSAGVKIKDLATGANVTGRARLRNYRYNLEATQTRRFSLSVKPIGKSPKLPLEVRLCASPSTRTSSKQDCVTCILK